VTQLAVEEEEEEEETEEENFGTEFPVSPRSPWDPMKEAHCIAVASRWAQSREVLELNDEEETLATRLIAAMNVSSTDINGDGLDERSKDCLITMTDEDHAVAAMSTRERGPVITKEILAKQWGIGLKTAHRTLMATTQQGIRCVLHPMERRYKTRQSHVSFPTLNTRFYTDTMFATAKSTRGHKCAQVFTNGSGYNLFYPMKKESDASEALNEFIWSVARCAQGTHLR
jgi:hypothetical protein